MKKAAIDIGTNSIRLLIAEQKSDDFKIIKKRLAEPRLGAGSQQNNYLKEDAISRSIEVLKDYKREAESYQAEVVAVATSAVREATNKEEFLKQVQEKVGLEIKVLSGEQEAYISYQGMVKGFEKLSDNILTIDIGGGSTEFIFGNRINYQDYKSFKLGAVRLKENFVQACDMMRERIEELISSYLKDKKVEQLIGVGGTITTLVAIKNSLSQYDADLVHGYQLSKTEIEKIFSSLQKLTLEERKQVVGLAAKRADIILPGIIILLKIMGLLAIDKIIVSDQSLLEGIIYLHNKIGDLNLV